MDTYPRDEAPSANTAPAPHRRRGRLLVAASLITLAGCGADKTEAASGPRDGDAEASLAAASGLAGRWAHFDAVAYQDQSMKTLILSYGFTDFAVEGDALRESEVFCHADQRSDQAMSTSISDAATQAIVPESTLVELTGTADTVRVQRPATPTPVGIRLEDPVNDKLPTDPSDPRIVDDDRDGHPGITVNVKVGDSLEFDIYLARREIFAYDMTRRDADTLTGTVRDSSEQLVVGSSNDALAGISQWRQHPDLSKSPITLRRVDPSWDCDRLAVERDRLFPETPVVDW